jgi:hypothetical protein
MCSRISKVEMIHQKEKMSDLHKKEQLGIDRAETATSESASRCHSCPGGNFGGASSFPAANWSRTWPSEASRRPIYKEASLKPL